MSHGSEGKREKHHSEGEGGNSTQGGAEKREGGVE